MATAFPQHTYENLAEYGKDEGECYKTSERSTHQARGKPGIYMNVPQERKQRTNVPHSVEQNTYMNLPTSERQSAVYMNLPTSPRGYVRYVKPNKQMRTTGECPNAPSSMRQLGNCTTVPIPNRNRGKYTQFSTFTRQPSPSVFFSNEGFSNPSYVELNAPPTTHEGVSSEEARAGNSVKSSNINEPEEEEKFWIPLFWAVFESLWGFWQDCSQYCISSTCVIPLQFLMFALSIASIIVGILTGPFCPLRWELPIFLMTLGSIRAVTVLLRVILVLWNKARPSRKLPKGPRIVTTIGSSIFLILFFIEFHIFFTSSPSFKRGDSNYCNVFFYYYLYCMNYMILGLMIVVAVVHGPTCVEFMQKRNG